MEGLSRVYQGSMEGLSRVYGGSIEGLSSVYRESILMYGSRRRNIATPHPA